MTRPPNPKYGEISKLKTLILGRPDTWATCRCPSKKNKTAELIDTSAERGELILEHILIGRNFTVSSCLLLDLISRSPKLKSVRFYGQLTKEEHHEFFLSVKFTSDLEAVYWPWCNMRTHKPTLRTLVKRHDQIKIFYTSADIACEFLNSELLPQVRYLSLIMNERWVCEPGKTKILKRYNRNICFLRKAKNVEALEVRTFDINDALSKDESGDNATHELIRRNYETYKLQFWESVSELYNLKYISMHGAWELEEVCRELAKRGIQIEYLRTSLLPNSILTNVEGSQDNSLKSYVLSVSDASKHISKLVKLKSLHFTCHEMLCNIDKQSASALRELSDLIWRIEIKCSFTDEVEELLSNILRRGNQNGRSYRIRMVINMSEEYKEYANVYAETVVKFSSTTTLKESLHEVAAQHMMERTGKSIYKHFIIYGIEQVDCGRDKAAFDQLRTTWNHYEKVFEPVDMFM